MSTTQSKNQRNTGTSHASDSKVSERVAHSIDSASVKLADAVEENGNALADMIEDTGSALADGADNLISDASEKVRYLRETEPKKLGADLLSLAKRHPILSLALGLGVGLLFSRLRRRR